MALNENSLFDNRYRLVKRLSDEGATADVWLAIDTLTLDKKLNNDDNEETVADENSGTRVAIKIYRPKNALDVEGESLFVKEFKTAYNCQHENLLTPTGYGIANDIPYLVMPYCSNGSVENLVGKMTDEKEIWKFLRQTASGLAFLHSCKPPIIHQDIKPGNILIDDNGNYRITDFGISVKRDSNSKGYLDDKDSGTTDYMPPERFEDNLAPRQESDIWSFGSTLFELITGKTPFGEEGGTAQLAESAMPQIDVPFSKDLKQIIYLCIDANMSNRPTASSLVEMANRKPFKKNNPLTYIMIFLLASILVAGIFLAWKSAKTPTPKDIRAAMCHTWVYDKMEENNREKDIFIESGVLYTSYCMKNFNINVNDTGTYTIERGNHFITITKAQQKNGEIVLMKIDWSIDTITPLQATFTTNMMNDSIELNNTFTYSRQISQLYVSVHHGLTPEYEELIPTERQAYKSYEDGKITGYTIKDPKIITFKSHDLNIATVNPKSGQIVGIQKGTTYIDVVTTEGTAVVEVNVQ